MDKKEILLILQSIKKPLLGSYGCFDTGIEFRILSNERGVFCRGGGVFPITGPLKFSQKQFSAVQKLKELDYENHPSMGNYIDEFIEELDDHNLTKSELSSVLSLSEMELYYISSMIEQGCTFNKNYYVYIEEPDEITFFSSYVEAEDYMISGCLSGGKKWTEMSVDELSDWYNHYEYALEDPFEGEELAEENVERI